MNSMRKHSRISSLLCLLLALLLFASLLLCACDTEDDAEDASSAGDVSKTEKGPLVPTLGEANYSGRVLRVLAPDEDKAFEFEPFGAFEFTSEPVNDACLSRNQLLSQEYGFTIETEFVEPFGPFIERVKQDLYAGTVDYDIASTGLQSMAKLAMEGAFLDLLSIENSHLSLDQPWWDSASNEDMTLMGKLFFTTGDIVLLDDEQTTCVYFNKTLVDDNQLQNPSQLVYDGTWTLDVMYEMAKAVAVDRDDGVMDVTGADIWGIVCAAFDTYKLIMGCDAPQAMTNAEGLPQLAMLNQHNANAFDKVYTIMKDTSCTAYTERFYAWNDPNAPLVPGNFYKGQALFLLGSIQVVNSAELREAEIRYGILPMPKYDETQENYASTVDPYRFEVLGIMSSCKDTDFVTFALEAMAYLSREMVTPEYYDRTLKNKRFLDDDDSPEMLDIIFSNRLVDLSVAFNWDDCIQYYNNLIFAASPDLASYVEQHQSAFNTAMNETIEYLTQLS